MDTIAIIGLSTMIGLALIYLYIIWVIWKGYQP